MIRSRSSIVLGLFVLAGQAALAAETADTVYVHGHVYTVDETHPWSEAFAVKGDRFIYVGTGAEAHKYAGPATKVVDLGGHMVMPGIHDGHIHLLMGGYETKFTCRLPTGPFGKQQEALIARLKECDATLEKGQWLLTGPFLVEQFVDGKPIRKFMDQAFPDRPILMRETTGHNSLANGKALELAGVTDASPDPAGGKFTRDSSGHVTGELVEMASLIVRSKIPPYTKQQNVVALKAAIDRLHKSGVTSVQESMTNRDIAEGLKELEDSGELTLEVTAHLASHKGAPDDANNESLIADRAKYASRHVDVNNIKMFLDGTPTGPYFTEVDVDPKTRKPLPEHLLVKPADLNEALKRFDGMGMRVKMHVAGAGSAQVALDAIEYARKANPASKIRHELAHSDLILPEDMDRMVPLNATADMSPAQWQYIGQFLGNPPQRAWRFKTMANKGILMTMGTDWPVIGDPNLFPGLGGVLDYGDESIDLALGIKMLTLNPAKSLGVEKDRGSITAGKLANFIVLDRQLFDVSPREVGATNVLTTVFEGRTVYSAARGGTRQKKAMKEGS